MSMMFGGGPEGKVAHTLELRLGSNQGPTSPPVRGDHIFEPQAKLGKSVPLLGPEPGKGQTQNDGNDMGGSGFERPKRSEEHTSELQSLMRISYAVFCLKKKK